MESSIIILLNTNILHTVRLFSKDGCSVTQNCIFESVGYSDNFSYNCSIVIILFILGVRFAPVYNTVVFIILKSELRRKHVN